MIIVLTKRVNAQFGRWEDDGQVAIAMEHVVSMEECSSATHYRYGTRISLANGEAYIVRESLQQIDELMRASVVMPVHRDVEVHAGVYESPSDVVASLRADRATADYQGRP